MKTSQCKLRHEQSLSGEGDLYVEGLHLEALNRRIRKAALKYQFVENTTIISSLLDRAENLLEIAYPNASAVKELAIDVIFHLEPSDWWKETKLCLKTRRYFNLNLNDCQYNSSFCTAGFQYTPYYYDNTKDSSDTNCVLKWCLFTPIYAEEWFKLTQICYKYKCRYNYSIGEFCAPINSYTSEYTDRSFKYSSGCEMSWMLKIETDDVIPFWF